MSYRYFCIVIVSYYGGYNGQVRLNHLKYVVYLPTSQVTVKYEVDLHVQVGLYTRLKSTKSRSIVSTLVTCDRANSTPTPICEILYVPACILQLQCLQLGITLYLLHRRRGFAMDIFAQI